MDENSMENENGFVMVDSPVTEENPEPVTPVEDVAAESVETVSGTERTEEASGTVEVEPAPMPSGDNTYRFQNIDAQYANRKKKKEPRKGMTIPRILVSAVLFGVVASACFFGVSRGLSFLMGNNGQIREVDTNRDDGVALTTVSGASATVADVSGIVERVMPSIVAITEKSTQTSYFGQTYSSEGAGSGFIVKQDNDQLLIVTNNHVVADADKISVTFNDNEVADDTEKGTSE